MKAVHALGIPCPGHSHTKIVRRSCNMQIQN